MSHGHSGGSKKTKVFWIIGIIVVAFFVRKWFFPSATDAPKPGADNIDKAKDKKYVVTLGTARPGVATQYPAVIAQPVDTRWTAPVLTLETRVARPLGHENDRVAPAIMKPNDASDLHLDKEGHTEWTFISGAVNALVFAEDADANDLKPAQLKREYAPAADNVTGTGPRPQGRFVRYTFVRITDGQGNELPKPARIRIQFGSYKPEYKEREVN